MARTSLKVLLPQVLGCTLCTPSLPLGPRPVLQVHTSAKILIAGQAPGRRVHASGVPFEDVSGDRLRDWLGVDREAFYNPRNFAILPMGFCYPGKGKSGDLPPRPECAPPWREALRSTLKQVEFTLVLGQYAQTYHLGADAGSVTELVQDWKRYWPSHLPLPHPSPRNQLWVRRNPWFAKEVLPALRRRVRALL